MVIHKRIQLNADKSKSVSTTANGDFELSVNV